MTGLPWKVSCMLGFGLCVCVACLNIVYKVPHHLSLIQHLPNKQLYINNYFIYLSVASATLLHWACIDGRERVGSLGNTTNSVISAMLLEREREREIGHLPTTTQKTSTRISIFFLWTGSSVIFTLLLSPNNYQNCIHVIGRSSVAEVREK